MTEQWSPVVGYEGLYSVSTRGRVRSEARTVSLGGTRLGQTRALPEKLLKPGIDVGIRSSLSGMAEGVAIGFTS